MKYAERVSNFVVYVIVLLAPCFLADYAWRHGLMVYPYWQGSVLGGCWYILHILYKRSIVRTAKESK